MADERKTQTYELKVGNKVVYVGTTNDQKRVDDRLDVSWVAVANIEGEDYHCEVTNVSTAGAMMRLDVELKVGFEFLLDVQDLDEYAAVVAWVNKPYYGVKLLAGEDMKLKEHADDVGLDPN